MRRHGSLGPSPYPNLLEQGGTLIINIECEFKIAVEIETEVSYSYFCSRIKILSILFLPILFYYLYLVIGWTEVHE